MREDIYDGLYDADLEELFRDPVSLLDLQTDPKPILVDLRSGTRAAEYDAVIPLVRQAEVAALLDWAGAVWTPTEFHFALPSGEHADRFVRVADALSSEVNLDRLSDWIIDDVPTTGFIVIDSATILPLAQRLQIRAMRRIFESENTIRILPLYGFPPERIRASFAEMATWHITRQRLKPHVLSLISVNASGGYVARFEEGLATCEQPPSVRHVIICNTGAPMKERTLCSIPVARHPAQECQNPPAMSIDQQSFTTRVLLGVRQSALPNYQEVSAKRGLMEALDAAGAFRVHSDRPEHGHLSVVVDTNAMLACEPFLQRANEAWIGATQDWRPDLVLIPKHDGSAALAKWVQGRGVNRIEVTATDYSLREECAQAIREATRIVLLDDALLTSRTMRALHECVQRTKQSIGDSEFETRGVILLTRPANIATLREFKKRFFVQGQRGFWNAVHMPLPDAGLSGAAVCPWCNEARFIGQVMPSLRGAAREYFTERSRRLQAREGLKGDILLLSDHPMVPDPKAGRHTSAGSYLGHMSDVGAYVFSSALIQEVRHEWQKHQTTFAERRVLSFQPLRYYTDPVIAGSLIRGARVNELWSPETAQDLSDALIELEHGRQHPVLAAEVLFAISRGKLPRTLDTEHLMTPHVNSPEILDVLRALMMSV